MSEWYEADDPLDSGVRLPSKTINWSWRWERVHSLRKDNNSLREISHQVGCSHEAVRDLLKMTSPPNPNQIPNINERGRE